MLLLWNACALGIPAGEAQAVRPAGFGVVDPEQDPKLADALGQAANNTQAQAKAAEMAPYLDQQVKALRAVNAALEAENEALRELAASCALLERHPKERDSGA